MPTVDRDFATGKQIDVSSEEEAVRQEYERILVESYGYPKAVIDIEVSIPRGSGHFPDRADIVIYRDETGRDPAKDILGIVEVKKPSATGGIPQIKSYMTATSSEWGVWTNSIDIAYLYKDGTQIRDDYLNNIPAWGQSVQDIGRLKKSELIPFAHGELKAVFRRVLFTLYSTASISRREKLGNEMMKIIFSKLQDEKDYADRLPEFRAEAGEPPEAVTKRVKKLFRVVCDELKQDRIFKDNEEIELDDKSVAWVVGQLERGCLLETESDVVGDAFEVFSESKFIGEKGEFFTPRNVVNVVVKLADPQPGMLVCDPACGSGGFLIASMNRIWSHMDSDPKWRGSKDIRTRKKEEAARSLFGIDKESDLVKIAKAHMMIAGDGRSNIVHENSLCSPSDFTGESELLFINDGHFKEFDVVLTNPPYGTKIKIPEETAAQFDLGHKWQQDKSGKWIKTGEAKKQDPYFLFIERCLDMLKEGGTLAIVLPETAFHAPTLGFLRQFMLTGNNLKAVIDLPHNTFRPHCNAKTCLLVLGKSEPQQERVIMGTPEQVGHDHLGRAVLREDTGELWDDLVEVLDEIDNPDSSDNAHVFTVAWGEINPDVLVPRYYSGLLTETAMPQGRHAVRLGDLSEKGVITAWDGHGSPKAKTKGEGPVPYIRVSDIVNWELYRNPVSGIPEHVYESMIKGKQKPEAGDIIFVRRGSYRIGTVAMVSPRDTGVLLTRELLTIRVDETNETGITPYYLLAMLSSHSVQQQIKNYVFMDTTLPNMHDRWKHLIVPVHDDITEIKRISDQVQESMKHKWSAQKLVDELEALLGGKIVR